MKRSIFSAFIGLAGLCLCGADFKITNAGVDFGDLKMNVSQNGALVFFHADTGNVPSITLWPTFATKHKTKWFSFNNPETKILKKDFNDKNTWSFSAEFPASEEEFVTLGEKVTVEPDGSIRVAYSWNTKNPSDILECFFYISVPMASVKGTEITVNGTAYKIEDISKYGFFNLSADSISLVVFKDSPEKKYTVKTDRKCKAVGVLAKNSSMMVRFYPVQGETDFDLMIIRENKK